MNRKLIFRTRYNGDTIMVKATTEEMEKLFQENKISDYTIAKIYRIKKEGEITT